MLKIEQLDVKERSGRYLLKDKCRRSTGELN